MSYSEILSSYIEKSEMSNVEIAKKCKEYNVKITASYISQLKSGKTPPPSEEVSKALAKVFDVNEDILIIEAFLERAPQSIIEFFDNLKLQLLLPTFALMYKEQFNDEMKNVIEEQIRNMPISTLILSMKNQKQTELANMLENGIISSNIDGDTCNIKLNEPVGLLVDDEGMEPLIKKGNHVIFNLQEKYTDGDMVAIMSKSKDNKGLFVRKIINRENKYILIPLNNNFEVTDYNTKDMIIMGKVNKVISEI